MNCWNVLDISPTDDAKLIKTMYARLLKHNKPDENPEGFQQLHSAYKEAISWAKYNKRAVIDEVGTEADKDHTEKEILSDESFGLEAVPGSTTHDIPIVQLESDFSTIVDSSATIDEPEIELEDLNQAWERLTDKTTDLLNSNDDFNNIEKWKFIEQSDALYEIEFKSEFSAFLFQQVFTHNQSSNDYHNKISIRVLRYMDSVFRWHDQRDILEKRFALDEIESVLGKSNEEKVVVEKKMEWTSPRQHKGEMVYSGYFSRIFATALDLLAFMFIYKAFSTIFRNVEALSSYTDLPIVLGALYLYLILVPIMESTPLQGTPGKILFGIKVVTPKGRRINILHSMLRTFIFSIVTALFKITVWINLFINDGRLLHDRISYSIIIKR